MPPSGIATVRKRPAPSGKHSAVEGVWASLVESRRHTHWLSRNGRAWQNARP